MTSTEIWGRNSPEKAAERLEELARKGKAPTYTDLNAAADLPHGVFAARVRREARGGSHLGWGLPAIPPHLEKLLAELIAEFPIAAEFQPYLERGIASLQDECASAQAIEEYFTHNFQVLLNARERLLAGSAHPAIFDGASQLHLALDLTMSQDVVRLGFQDLASRPEVQK